jgi:PadR family transcriptional regulator, regulatory protein PadR
MSDETPITKKRTRGARNGHGPDVQPRMTGDMLTSSLLAFLRRWNAYGYQLVQELGKAGLPGFDPTTVYRTLRQLERDGLVSSFWDTSESGPARRRYALTNSGETFLDVWADIFGKYQQILQSAWTLTDNSEASADAAPTEESDKPKARRNRNARTER